MVELSDKRNSCGGKFPYSCTGTHTHIAAVTPGQEFQNVIFEHNHPPTSQSSVSSSLWMKALKLHIDQ